MFDENLDRLKKGYFEAGILRYAKLMGMIPVHPALIERLWKDLQEDVKEASETSETDEI